MAAPILVVTGPSGAGKTTVSTLVADRFDPCVRIRTDDFLHFVAHGWIDPMTAEAAHQNHVLGGAFTAAAIQFAMGGYTVVLDGHIFPDGVDGIAQMAARHTVPVHYVVLRPALEICLERAAGRGSDDGRFRFDADSLGEQHGRFSDLARYEANVIDSTAAPGDVADEILRAFAAGLLLSSGA